MIITYDGTCCLKTWHMEGHILVVFGSSILWEDVSLVNALLEMLELRTVMQVNELGDICGIIRVALFW